MFGGMAFGILVSITHNYVHVNNSASFSLSFPYINLPQNDINKGEIIFDYMSWNFPDHISVDNGFPCIDKRSSDIWGHCQTSSIGARGSTMLLGERCCRKNDHQGTSVFHVLSRQFVDTYIFISCAKFKTEKIRYNTVNLE